MTLCHILPERRGWVNRISQRKMISKVFWQRKMISKVISRRKVISKVISKKGNEMKSFLTKENDIKSYLTKENDIKSYLTKENDIKSYLKEGKWYQKLSQRREMKWKVFWQMRMISKVISWKSKYYYFFKTEQQHFLKWEIKK